MVSHSPLQFPNWFGAIAVKGSLGHRPATEPASGSVGTGHQSSTCKKSNTEFRQPQWTVFRSTIHNKLVRTTARDGFTECSYTNAHLRSYNCQKQQPHLSLYNDAVQTKTAVNSRRLFHNTNTGHSLLADRLIAWIEKHITRQENILKGVQTILYGKCTKSTCLILEDR